MSDIESIVREVDGSMAMEGMPLHSEDKDRIRKCLADLSGLEKDGRFFGEEAHHSCQREETGMMGEYSYSYQWDREYCYPDSNVLINKLNIQDAEALHTAEREITSLRLAVAKMQPIKGKFGLKHLQKIHGYVFGDVYEWAGRLRHVDIAKGNQFCLAMNLDTYGGKLFKKLEQEHYLIDSKENVPHRLAYYLSEINVLHPFREGNGRTQRLFIEYLAAVAGCHVDFSQVSAEEMIVASADSFACDYESINRMFERITTPISKAEQREHIQFFFGVRSKLLSLVNQ